MAENIPNLGRKWISSSGNHRVPNTMNPKRPTPRHIVIKMAKVNFIERNLMAAREKLSHTRESHIRL